MVAQVQTDLEVTQGSDGVYNLAFLRNQLPVDITGALIWLTVKRRYTDADPGICQLVVGDGIVVTNAVGGLATAQVPASATDGIDAPIRLFYDVKVEESTGLLSTPIFGVLIVRPAVTLAP